GTPVACTASDQCHVAGTCDTATGTCSNPVLSPNLRAAITEQVTTIDAADIVHLDLELVTLTTQPFQLTAEGLSHPSGLILESVGPSSCTAEVDSGVPTYRCHHSARLQAYTACTWDGDYVMTLTYNCDPALGCSQCSASESIPFSLESEN